ncbi:MAG: lysine--tRNA ligase [Candidatus Buchananbacteria bacterium RIFCSPHIGHO2_01_FULL_44_11]|uniref:Lysine--tRNA ligase n=1 Tax=Candidatus Buchananbacteria bacterium RIFCSPHIGHO2_01_FULL_44_11 TaxID=1797535 RepID=A0A1G1Y404_9BACT|nr:MAG: lysine--tRNA ligase [Candidatus Buchananbacteria bacterium RIFCSPHIGHO2_01_FULL_44_11]
MADNLNDEYKIRLAKLENIRKEGVNPYPEKFDKIQPLAEILSLALGTKIKTAGRLLTIRAMGKIVFCHILDDSGRLQIVLQKDEVGEKNLEWFLKFFDPGDFIGLAGEVFKTKKGEVSILVKDFVMLGKALRPLPEKWHGLKDQEALYRQRYLDLIANPETRQRFLLRSNFIKLLRDFYWQQGFIEVETPILTNTASGALAKPFKTHHNALNTDVYLRIAPETYLKECVVGGFEKVFEIARCFRNEGMDPSHLQDFTMVEHYAAYWNYEDNMNFTEKMFSFLIKELFGQLKIEIKDRQGKPAKVDFTPPWPKVSLAQIIKKDCGLDINQFTDAQALAEAIKAKKINIDGINDLGLGNLIDALYKAVCRQKIIQPTFLIQHPIDLSPLARRNDKNPNIVDRFQLVVNGWEVVNAYSELVDSVDQRQRFAAQAQAKAAGDLEAHGKDDEFVKALEYGAPPISGWGMGVDRLIAILTQQDNLRDVILFPLLRPEQSV